MHIRRLKSLLEHDRYVVDCDQVAAALLRRSDLHRDPLAAVLTRPRARDRGATRARPPR